MALRTYGRTRDLITGKKTWVVVTTDVDGWDDEVWLTTLAQCCKLNLGESPFWADWGIPAHASVVTQIAPDFYMALMQRRFAPHFLSLTMQKIDGVIDDDGHPSPYYYINVVTNYGAFLPLKVPI